MYDDDNPGDQYDWDQSDDRQYCEHGTFVGSWWGPDILCGWCEDGISAAEQRDILAAQRRREAERHDAQWDALMVTLRSLGYSVGQATAYMVRFHGIGW